MQSCFAVLLIENFWGGREGSTFICNRRQGRKQWLRLTKFRCSKTPGELDYGTPIFFHTALLRNDYNNYTTTLEPCHVEYGPGQYNKQSWT